MYTKEEEINLIKTASKGGIVGRGPTVVTQWTEKLGWKNQHVLDYGCGQLEFQSTYLKKIGFIVTPYDIGYARGVLDKPYDIIMISNVLNVQPHLSGLNDILEDIYYILGKEHSTGFTFALVNYPKSPRKMNWNEKKLVKHLKYFGFLVDKLPVKNSLLFRLIV